MSWPPLVQKPNLFISAQKINNSEQPVWPVERFSLGWLVVGKLQSLSPDLSGYWSAKEECGEGGMGTNEQNRPYYKNHEIRYNCCWDVSNVDHFEIISLYSSNNNLVEPCLTRLSGAMLSKPLWPEAQLSQELCLVARKSIKKIQNWQTRQVIFGKSVQWWLKYVAG